MSNLVEIKNAEDAIKSLSTWVQSQTRTQLVGIPQLSAIENEGAGGTHKHPPVKKYIELAHSAT